MIGVFRSVYKSKVCTCIAEYVDRVNQCVVCLMMLLMSRCRVREVVGVGLLVSVLS